MVNTSSHNIYRKFSTSSCSAPSIAKNTEKKKPLDWSSDHNTAFKNVLKLVAEITQNKHFDQQLETRIVCAPEGWIAVAYASRFLNPFEEKYSVNELELLGVVWAIEHFKYYLYGKHFYKPYGPSSSNQRFKRKRNIKNKSESTHAMD